MQRVSAATLAYDTVNDPENTIVLVDRPRQDRRKLRVCGPSAVETESPYSYASPSDPEDADSDDLGVAHMEDRTAMLETLTRAAIMDADGYTTLRIVELESWPAGRLVLTGHGVGDH